MDQETRKLDLDDGIAHREYALGLSAQLHFQCLDHRPRDRPADHRDAHRRCLRRDAADRAADTGAGDVSLPVRLYRQGRRHRARRGRATGDLLSLLRRTLHPAPSERLWRAPARSDRAPQSADAGWSIPDGRAAPHGTGKRMPIAVTRALLDAALVGRDQQPADAQGSDISASRCRSPFPASMPRLLNPRDTWADGAAYDVQAHRLVQMFITNFAKFETYVGDEVRACAPATRTAA